MTLQKESPEGWRAWPLWLRAMLLIMLLLIVAGGLAVATSLPASARSISIAGAPDMDFIAYVIAYRSSGRLLAPSDNMGQAERVCIGIDRNAFGDIADNTDMVTLASETVSITLNDVPVPLDSMAFAYDPTIISVVDSAGQTIGEGHGTLGVCFRTSDYPLGDYIGGVTIARTDSSTRYYEWAFSIQ
ncbi:MAG: hypothetical protein U0694_07760 [Anaerolineae bacterium]